LHNSLLTAFLYVTTQEYITANIPELTLIAATLSLIAFSPNKLIKSIILLAITATGTVTSSFSFLIGHIKINIPIKEGIINFKLFFSEYMTTPLCFYNYTL